MGDTTDLKRLQIFIYNCRYTNFVHALLVAATTSEIRTPLYRQAIFLSPMSPSKLNPTDDPTDASTDI